MGGLAVMCILQGKLLFEGLRVSSPLSIDRGGKGSFSSFCAPKGGGLVASAG